MYVSEVTLIDTYNHVAKIFITADKFDKNEGKMNVKGACDLN